MINKNINDIMELKIPERAISSKVTDLNLLKKLNKRSDSISFSKKVIPVTINQQLNQINQMKNNINEMNQDPYFKENEKFIKQRLSELDIGAPNFTVNSNSLI